MPVSTAIGRLKPGLEGFDEAFEKNFPGRHSVGAGLAQGLPGGPSIVPDAVAGDDGACAIAAVFAMNEHRLGRLFDNRQNFVHVVDAGVSQAAHRYLEVMHSERAGLVLLGHPGIAGQTQIDNGPDAAVMQELQPEMIGLSAAV